MKSWKSGLTCSIVLVASACGGPQARSTAVEDDLAPEAPPAPSDVAVHGTSEARARIGRAGGTLSLANGARLVIPPGALSEETEVALLVGAEGHAFGDAERQRALGPMLAVEPAIVSAGGVPFELSIPEQPIPTGFERSDLAFAIEETHEGARAIETLATRTRWQFYPVVVEGGRFVVRTSGFGGHRVQFGVAR